ncbi:MRP-L47-domain-containing protein [Choiromyces venosus 120613-1]|uniref:Large ribosomal subunit protein uL29m n=1 Tax=Choiromyces venosus 120613-1 TaxID=1336337 RepID=A0A3N4JWS5_9PEZI|nr:MRP-L47-domain-containing protein [Choiromyces venosus 120613-1]
MSLHSLARPATSLRQSALLVVRASSSSQFHTTAAPLGRWVRDRNKNRGVSAIHRQPKKNIQISVSNVPLPEPVLDPSKRTAVNVNPEHGLWGFFRGKNALPTPEEDHKHGRPWTAAELRRKSWEDLQKLWWVCVKERNIMETQKIERQRLKPGYGEFESNTRYGQIRVTQRAIKHVLTERYYAWQEAQKVAATDPEVDLSGEGPAYQPVDSTLRTAKLRTAKLKPKGQRFVDPIDEIRRQVLGEPSPEPTQKPPIV